MVLSLKYFRPWLNHLNSWLHLWLGLFSGVIVFVVALTGTIFVFCDETIDAFAGQAKYVEVQKHSPLSPEKLVLIFKEHYPDRKVFYFDAYKAANRSIKIGSSNTEQKDLSYTWINPYNGQVIKESRAYYFFYLIAHIHSELLLHEAGRTLVGISTLVFFFQQISGLFLWWPVNQKALQSRVIFKWKNTTGWRRKNYDLHNILGFYSLIPALLLTITGLIMAYETIGNFTQKTFGGNINARAMKQKLSPAFLPPEKSLPYEKIMEMQFRQNPTAEVIRIVLPRKDSTTTMYCIVAKKIGLKSWENGYSGMINRYSGQFVSFPQDIIKSDKIETLYFDLHVGYWYGMTSKILTFLIGIICTSLPITGFYIWWGRKKKKGNPSKLR